MKKILALLMLPFLALAVALGSAAPATANTGNSTNFYYHDYVPCPDTATPLLQTPFSNYDINGQEDQRYHFKMDWSNSPWLRPDTLLINGYKFGSYPSNQRSGTLYDGFIDFDDIYSTNTFDFYWKDSNGNIACHARKVQ